MINNHLVSPPSFCLSCCTALSPLPPSLPPAFLFPRLTPLPPFLPPPSKATFCISPLLSQQSKPNQNPTPYRQLKYSFFINLILGNAVTEGDTLTCNVPHSACMSSTRSWSLLSTQSEQKHSLSSTVYTYIITSSGPMHAKHVTSHCATHEEF